MVKKNERKEKLCMFFASDYHFEMITIPYINKNLENNKKIIMVTENNLDDSVEKVLSRINITNEQKERIKKIGWENNNLDKLEKIRCIEKEKTIIFIKGNEKYVDDINKNIGDAIDNKDIEVIDCYDMNKLEGEVGFIAKKYNKFLSTSGIEKMLK